MVKLYFFRKRYLNFTGYGHADNLDFIFRKAAYLVCKTCEKDCDYELFRNELA